MRRLGGVDHEQRAVGGDLQPGVGQHEIADIPIQRETVHAVAGGEDQHRPWSVEGQPGADLPIAGLPEVLRQAWPAAGPLQHREGRAGRQVVGQVGHPVHRLEQQQVPPGRRHLLDLVRARHRNAGQLLDALGLGQEGVGGPPAQGTPHLFLGGRLASGRVVDQRPAGHRRGGELGRHRDRTHDVREVGLGRVPAEVQQVLGQGSGCHRSLTPFQTCRRCTLRCSSRSGNPGRS